MQQPYHLPKLEIVTTNIRVDLINVVFQHIHSHALCWSAYEEIDLNFKMALDSQFIRVDKSCYSIIFSDLTSQECLAVIHFDKGLNTWDSTTATGFTYPAYC